MNYQPEAVFKSNPYWPDNLAVLDSTGPSGDWHVLPDRLRGFFEKPRIPRAASALGAAVLAAMALAGGTASASPEKTGLARINLASTDAPTGPAVPPTVKSKESAPIASALRCEVDAIGRIGRFVTVQIGGCKIGDKPVAAKWTWTAKSYDLTGSPCKRFGSAKGTGRQLPLPKRPSDLPGNLPGGYMPGIFETTFNVSASAPPSKPRGKKRTARATGSLTIQTPDSHVLCGEPPQLINLEGPESKPLRWAGPGSLIGWALKPPAIISEGNGICRYVPVPARMEGGYLVYGNSINCPNGVYGETDFVMSYTSDGETVCRTFVKRASSFLISPYWGSGTRRSGLVYPRLFINSWSDTWKDYSNNQAPYTDENMWSPGWLGVGGNIDPCAKEPGWTGRYPLGPTPTATTSTEATPAQTTP